MIPQLRADARRNRDAILLAAREVFSEQGINAPLELVANRAGVGRATLYRRFPTRDDLIEAIFDSDREELREIIASTPDPSQTFFAILEHTLVLQTRNAAILEMFTSPNVRRETLTRTMAEFHVLLAGPLERAQRAGLVREDVLPADIGTLLVMLAATGPALRHEENGQLRRARAWRLLLDGITPAGSAQRTLPT